MTKRDYYEILGLTKGASADQIKSAYRKLAMQYHPDRNKASDAESKFKEISEAYAVLSDDKKKAQYDQYGHAGFDQMYSQEDIFKNANFSDFEDMFGGFGNSPFGDIFGSIFGGNRGRGREYGADLQTQMEITLEEAASGIKKDFTYHRSKACSKCSGSGEENGSTKTTCSSCAGRGQVQQARRAGPMSFYTVVTCPKCRGYGSIVKNPCKNCQGNGKVSEQEHIKVEIPPGIADGMRIRLDDLGEYGRDAPGDLYVFVRIKDHPKFRREEDDLWIEIPISFYTAAIGAEIEVPTLNGTKKINIPSGTQSHTVITLKGEGMPHLRNRGKGDQLIRVIVEVPKKLSKKQKELLKQFDEEKDKKTFGLF